MILNGHAEERGNRFEGVHGESGIGERSLEGGMLLEFCDRKDLYVVNAWLKRRERRRRFAVQLVMRLRLTFFCWKGKAKDSWEMVVFDKKR